MEDSDLKNNKTSKRSITIIIIIILLLISLVAGIYLIFFNKNINNTGRDLRTDGFVEESDSEIDSENSFTQANQDEDGDIEHNLKLTIISPEEEYFQKGQARMYNALVEGNGKYATTIKCMWKFYIDENNGEYLYQEQEGSGILAGESKEVCGFTSTFIEKRGKLRVELTMTVYDATNENLETIVADREYVVN